MQVVPNVKVTRFEQLEPGDLFIMLYRDRSCLALKAVDQLGNGDKLILPLDPSFTKRALGPHLLGWQGATAVSFGRDYTVRLPTASEAWAIQAPEYDVFCLAVTSDHIYFRANFSTYENDFRACWVRAADGEVIYDRLPPIMAYALQWEIVIEDTTFPAQMLLKQPSSRAP